MKKLAIDIGYGHTKVQYGEKIFKFPTAIAISKTQMTENESAIEFEGKKYLVGDDALRNAITTRDYAFIYRYSPLLIYKALLILGIQDEKDISINTGLSLYDIEKDAEFDSKSPNRGVEFKKRISHFFVDQKEFTFSEVKLFAQGQGVWNDFCSENGYLENGYEVVVDIGYRTNDIIVFKDGKPEKSESAADDKGVNVVVGELRKIINKRYDITLTEQEVAQVLKDKSILIYGVEKDLSMTVDDIIENYIDSLFASLKSEFGTILKSSRRVIISGGGAHILLGNKDSFPSNVVFRKDGEFEFSNVRGYYNG